MAVDPTAYFVGGGAEHSPEIVRAAFYDSTGGSEGVAGALDLKVLATSPASAGVSVLPGGGIMVNRYPGGANQSYKGRNASSTFVPITATGSAGTRSDLVIMRVLDPQYEGQPPADPLTFDYTRLTVIEGVPQSTVSVLDLNLPYPAIELARVDMPVSTAAVAAGYVTDLRKIAQPKVQTDSSLLFPSNDKIMSKTGYDSWPFSGTMTNILVPYWANQLEIVAHVSGAEITGTAGAKQVGGIRTGFDVGAGGIANYSQNGIIVGTPGRQSVSIIGKHAIPTSRRGRLVTLTLQGYQTSGTGGIQADYQTSIAVDYRFKEVLA